MEGDYHVMVLDLMGPSLEDLFNYCGRRLNLKVKMPVLLLLLLLHGVGHPHQLMDCLFFLEIYSSFRRCLCLQTSY